MSENNNNDSQHESYLNNLRITTRVKFLRIISILTVVLLIPYGIYSHIIGSNWLSYVLLSIGSIAMANIFLFHRVEDYSKAVALLSIYTVCTGSVLTFSGGDNGTGQYWLAPVLATIIFSTRFIYGMVLSLVFATFVSLSLLLDAPWVSYQYEFPEMIRLIITSYMLIFICLAREYYSDFSLSQMDTMRESLATAANTDPLTQLFNRRFVMENYIHHDHFPAGVEHCSTVLLGDIDHFKQINDRYGHDAGDQVLKMVADSLRATTRDGDILARWGGEEFLIILSNISQEVAQKRAQQFIERIAGETLYLDEGILKVTMSIGMSQAVDGKLASEVLKEADINLYKAKESGRNKVCF